MFLFSRDSFSVMGSKLSQRKIGNERKTDYIVPTMWAGLYNIIMIKGDRTATVQYNRLGGSSM